MSSTRTEGRPRVAFVGSGGATKGIAHIGALKAIEELGIVPDIYVGASAGAIIGAFASQGFRADELIAWIKAPWLSSKGRKALRSHHFLGLPNWGQLRVPGYLLSGVLSIDRFERFLADHLPVNDFRKLAPMLIITAADVDQSKRVVFGRGYVEDVPISQAIAASSCVPVLFRPYRIGNKYYLDGEVVRTLSVDLAVEAGADVVIISNVYRPYITKPSETSVAMRGIGAVVRQSLNVVLSEKEKRGLDLIHKQYPHVTLLNVSADLGKFPFLSRTEGKALLGRGYREAVRVLSAAKLQGVFELNQRTISS
ncbi:MAG: patatin-like phospholipase family protein [Myxococcales bacterium]|nr:patatin-like phospholipase family protein [Myxococcales bacterium]